MSKPNLKKEGMVVAEEANRIDALDDQIVAVADTHKSIADLIQKLARVQAALSELQFDDFSAQIAEPFAGMAAAAEKLESLAHDMELERNRLRSEAG